MGLIPLYANLKTNFKKSLPYSQHCHVQPLYEVCSEKHISLVSKHFCRYHEHRFDVGKDEGTQAL